MAERRICINAPDGDQPLWRYMDFPRFVDTLQHKSLWFTRLDQFRDLHEGELTTPTAELFAERRRTTGFRGGVNHEKWKKIRCVNCWFMGSEESAAMWPLYAKDSGIAVRSSIVRLRDSFPSEVTGGSWMIYGSPVSYVDYEKDTMAQVAPDGAVTMTLDCMCKRISFEHEKEYRLVTNLEQNEQDRPGKHISVMLNVLIEAILVSPTAPSWIVDVVRKDAEIHGLKVPIARSILYDPRK
jgi:hypothetical protein